MLNRVTFDPRRIRGDIRDARRDKMHIIAHNPFRKIVKIRVYGGQSGRNREVTGTGNTGK